VLRARGQVRVQGQHVFWRGYRGVGLPGFEESGAAGGFGGDKFVPPDGSIDVEAAGEPFGGDEHIGEGAIFRDDGVIASVASAMRTFVIGGGEIEFSLRRERVLAVARVARHWELALVRRIRCSVSGPMRSPRTGPAGKEL